MNFNECFFCFLFALQKVTFDAGPQLQFLFHSDSSNNEWGYKFTVTALGLPDITISWMSDLQLLVARLMGRLASRTLALKSPYGKTIFNIVYQTKVFWLWPTIINWNAVMHGFLSIPEIRSVKELPSGKVSHVQSSPLWKPILRHGLCETREANRIKPPTDEVSHHICLIQLCWSAIVTLVKGLLKSILLHDFTAFLSCVVDKYMVTWWGNELPGGLCSLEPLPGSNRQ